MTTLVLIYSHIINQAKNDKGSCGNVPSRGKKEFFLVSIMNKSQYCETHWEDTIDNVWDTDNFLLFGAVSRKQHTINLIFK